MTAKMTKMMTTTMMTTMTTKMMITKELSWRQRRRLGAYLQCVNLHIDREIMIIMIIDAVCEVAY
jgi:hypothetical protein